MVGQCYLYFHAGKRVQTLSYVAISLIIRDKTANKLARGHLNESQSKFLLDKSKIYF